MEHPPSRRAVGYVRVSTREQEAGVGLDAQTAAIKRYALEHELSVMHIYEDVASGMTSKALDRNPGLADAVREAAQLGVPLLVSDIGRVARNEQSVDEVQRIRNVQIIDVQQETSVDPIATHGSAEHHRVVGERISITTRGALERRRAEGKPLGNKVTLPTAQRNGALSNKARAEQLVEEIAAVLKVHDAAGRWTAREAVDALNARKIHTRQGGQWTLAKVRRPLAAARKLIAQSQWIPPAEFGMF